MSRIGFQLTQELDVCTYVGMVAQPQGARVRWRLPAWPATDGRADACNEENKNLRHAKYTVAFCTSLLHTNFTLLQRSPKDNYRCMSLKTAAGEDYSEISFLLIYSYIASVV